METTANPKSILGWWSFSCIQMGNVKPFLCGIQRGYCRIHDFLTLTSSFVLFHNDLSAMENYTKMPIPMVVQSLKTDLFVRLNEIFHKERLFLNPSLRISHICESVHACPKTLGRALKKRGFRNFAHFVNYYRIEEAKRMMATAEHEIYTLEAIADMAGFGTRQAFYNAFEQMTGMKPAGYRNLMKQGKPSAREPRGKYALQ